MPITDTPTTIDLAPLLALRDEVAPIHDELIERMNAGHVDAYEDAGELLKLEDEILTAIKRQFADLYPSDVDQTDANRADDAFNDVIYALAPTGNLSTAVDDWRQRVEDAAIDEAVEAFAKALEVPAVRQHARDGVVGALRQWVAEGRMGPDEWNAAQVATARHAWRHGVTNTTAEA